MWCEVYFQQNKKRRNPKTREGAKSGVTRLDRMKRGSGIKGRDDRSSGIEIRIADAFGTCGANPFFFNKETKKNTGMEFVS